MNVEARDTGNWSLALSSERLNIRYILSIKWYGKMRTDIKTRREVSRNIWRNYRSIRRSQWPFGLGRSYAVSRLLRLWVRIPPGTWTLVCCESSVLLGRGLCQEPITRPEVSCRLWCVIVCDLETSIMRRPWPALGSSATGKNVIIKVYKATAIKLCVCSI